MKQVSQEEFYKVMGPLDVHPSIQPGPYPYTSLWKLHRKAGEPVVGKSVGKGDGSSTYFVVEA